MRDTTTVSGVTGVVMGVGRPGWTRPRGGPRSGRGVGRARDGARSAALCALAGVVLVTALGLLPTRVEAQGPCGPPVVNPIACENSNPGNPRSEWDVSGAGDSNIQGFATDISVNRGQPIRFKVSSDATAYRFDIYRMGYYGGLGARLITTIRPSVSLPQLQPACFSDAATGLVDCGNWAVSASWTVPTTAVTGVYFAKLVREDGITGSSHIVFVVRDDSSTADVVFQTSDTTWQAYNRYGGNSLYVGSPAGRAYKVSYNRPFTTRGTTPRDWVFNAEYPMVRWLEANGYNISYISGVDTDRDAARLLQHKVFLSVGHDEYWSGGQRANVEAARGAGVHLAFLSGNESFWKTRWEPSIDGTATPYRTLVCYKETHADAKIDPLPNVWTGTWRDPRFSPPADGGRPENGLTGTIFMVNCCADAITVPAADGKMRFWRGTSIATQAPGATAALPNGTLGYEWDADLDNGFRPAGLFRLSSTTLSELQILQDYGSTYGAGTATHALTLYRRSGALVFGAGTIQWSWGLDGNHDRGASTPDVRMQQATVNLLADMGVQPATLQAGLAPASPSTDTTSPTSTITSPAAGANLTAGRAVTVIGTAADIGGVVGGVEVSVDGGGTWRPATGRANWSYTWTPGAAGSVTLKSRAVDDSGNIETPGAGVTVTVVSGTTCPCTIWPNTATPATPAESDPNAIEVGVKFRSDVSGYITALRFYKGSTNTGIHVGNLWTATGTLLASVTFSGETASGWQQVTLPTPVPITANTTYVASYHTDVGHYAVDAPYFATAGVDSPPLHALRSGADGPNGVYAYGPSAFPTSSFNASNYWVDAVFSTTATIDTTPPVLSAISPTNGASGVPTNTTVTATFSKAMDATTITTSTFVLRNPAGTAVAAPVTYNGATATASITPGAALALSTTYTATVKGGATGVKDVSGNAMTADFAWSFTTAASSPTTRTCPCTIWPNTATPAVASEADPNPVEVGVKFRADVDGFTTGLRFYKGTLNTGTHIGNLWTSTGALLASVTFSPGESTSGWQQVDLPTPVRITANTTYVASYHTDTGHYSATAPYFVTAGVDSPPLHALANGVDGPNGVYKYGASGFPTASFNASNYWVDVVFNPTVASDTTPPTVIGVSPASGATGVATGTTVTATFSEAMDATTIATSTVDLRDPSGAVVPAAVTYDSPSLTATLTPGVLLAPSTTYTARVKGGATGVKDLAANPMTIDFTWSFTTAAAPPPATTPPTVTAVSPASGATGVATGTTVTATFSKAMDATTISATTFVLLDAASTLVFASVSYDGTARTATLTPRAALAAGATYTATVSGGPAGVKDLAGNPMTSNFTWSFTTAAPVPSACPCTIWPGTATPATPAEADPNAVEVGVKFRSDVSGYITALRFYKGSTNTGIHVGNLWTATGTLLASVTFISETASGWQQATLSSPVLISAKTTYVASYHTNVGHYAATAPYFATAGVDSPPLHALQIGVDGPNGVYAYGPSAFPTSTFNAGNYWVDVVFNTTATADTTPPTVTTVSPKSGAIGVVTGTVVTATFSKEMNASTIGTGTFELRDPSNTVVPSTMAYNFAARSAILVPAALLVPSTTYTARVKGGSSGVKDISGNALAADVTWSFTTAMLPTQGPGGPILVVTTSTNPSIYYYAEILRAEGFNAFAVADLSTVTATTLSAYDVVILGQMSLSSAQATMFINWVNGGGNLLAMRPDKQLAGLLGLAPTSSTLSDAYLLVDTSTAPGAGIVNQTIQFHGAADLYTLSGATSAATLYSSATTATTNPAVTLRNVGVGRAAAFTYDLARSVVYTRQGNPAWAGQERDGYPPIRSDDLFFGGPQPDWVDLSKVAIPQADEQQRLLANLILQMNQSRKPLPRFWYFPRGFKAVVVMTGDDHANGGTGGRFDSYIANSPPGCVVDNWECIRSTSYVYPGTPLSDPLANAYTAQGFEVSIHINPACANWTPLTLESFYSSQLSSWAASFPSLPSPTTHRLHCVVWSDWSTQPQIELNHSMRLDVTYYYWPASWVNDRPGMFAGSGMPMRFATTDGTMIDVYQATTEMTDESGQSYPVTINTLLDNALGLQGYYGAFTANMHTDAVASTGSDAIVASAVARVVPIVSARQMLTWLDGRNGSYFGSLTWDGSTLSFTIAVAEGANGLRAMLPATFAGKTLTGITQGGSPVAFTSQTIKGIIYAFFPAASGAYQAVYR